MARDTADYIPDGEAIYRPFYYLKITGLPYYFFSIVNPTLSRYGASAWTLPTGYTGVRGMSIPKGTFEQKLPDMLGGIASAERFRAEMYDFETTDANGRHNFFGRLMAPGRIITSTTAARGQLSSDIQATLTTGNTFTVQGTTANGFTVGNVYIGGETMSISDADYVAPEWTLTIDERNLFPCTTDYPATPYHRAAKDGTGTVIPSTGVIVTQEPLTIIGRSCALYIGHMDSAGLPEPEANANLRMIGRIKSVDYGQDPGIYSFEIESIVADLANARVAPGLAQAELLSAIYLPSVAWRTMTITAVREAVDNVAPSSFKSATITIDDGGDNIYDNLSLIAAVNAKLAENPLSPDDATLGLGTFTFSIAPMIDDDGNIRAIVRVGGFVIIPAAGDDGINYTFSLTFTAMDSIGGAGSGTPTWRHGGSLLLALGFPYTTTGVVIQGSAGADRADTIVSAIAERPMPNVFVPTSIVDAPFAVALTDTQDANGDRFNTTQGSTDEQGLVRLGNGAIMEVISHAARSLTLKPFPTVTNNPDPVKNAFHHYFVEPGSIATVEQIIRAYPYGRNTPETAFARLLCSTRGVATDGEYNYYPEGVGLGLNGVIDKPSFRQLSAEFGGRFNWDVDNKTKFGDLWNAVAKESGFFLVWDPEQSLITLRQLRQVNSTLASDFEFTESNRPNEQDRSTATMDFSNIRTGFTLKYGWDAIEGKFKAGGITITDGWTTSAYGVESRVETLSDITLLESSGAEASEIIGRMVSERSQFVRYPWIKITRTVNKTGLLLSPGTYHHIIDNTISNPFTGTFGIADGDGVYAWLMAVSSTLDDAKVTVTYLVDQISDVSLIRPLSPTALVDFSATTNGYDNTTGVVTFVQWYDPDGYDGLKFEVGDPVAFIPNDTYSGAPFYEKTSTITAVATDGHTATVAASLGAFSTTVETIMLLRPYASSTTSRKTGASKVAFQGDGVTLLIDSSATLHKWS